MSHMLLYCITLLNIGIASHDVDIFNKNVSIIEYIMGITLPCREEHTGEYYEFAARCQQEDLSAILDNKL